MMTSGDLPRMQWNPLEPAAIRPTVDNIQKSYPSLQSSLLFVLNSIPHCRPWLEQTITIS